MYRELCVKEALEERHVVTIQTMVLKWHQGKWSQVSALPLSSLEIKYYLLTRLTESFKNKVVKYLKNISSLLPFTDLNKH